MKRVTIVGALLCVVALVPMPAEAGRVYISFGAPPPLVEVEPGVQVVPDIEREVFFADGAYWYATGGYWYRSADWRGGWVRMSPRRVPYRLAHVHRGHYVHYRPREFRGPAPVVYHHPRPVYRHDAPPRPRHKQDRR